MIEISNIFKFATVFEKLAQETPKASSQVGDVYTAIIQKGDLGLKGDPAQNNVQWDPNSPTGDYIFGLFDKAKFKGSATINVIVSPDKKVNVQTVTAPNSAAIASAISKYVTPRVSVAIKDLAPPAQLVTVPEIIQASNG